MDQTRRKLDNGTIKLSVVLSQLERMGAEYNPLALRGQQLGGAWMRRDLAGNKVFSQSLLADRLSLVENTSKHK